MAAHAGGCRACRWMQGGGAELTAVVLMLGRGRVAGAKLRTRLTGGSGECSAELDWDRKMGVGWGGGSAPCSEGLL